MNIKDILELLLTGFALIVSVGAFVYAYKTDKEFSNKEAIQNINELFLDRYSRRFLTSEYKYSDNDYKTLRELRTLIQSMYGISDASALNHYYEQSLIIGTVENKFAYEASLALQEIGLMVLTGAIPLEIAISSNGHQFMEDWLYCYKLVYDRIRSTQKFVKRKIASKVGYPRIHAEWLSNFSYIFFSKEWESDFFTIYKNHFESQNMLPKSIEQEIRRIEGQIIPKYINRKIEKLIKT